MAGLKSAPLGLRLKRGFMAPINILKVPLTRVLRCTTSDEPSCQLATKTRFVGANGIAISEDRKSVFVNDPARRRVTVFERLSSGYLLKVSAFETKHSLDNIEMTPEGQLSAGTIPLLYTTGVVCDEAPELSANKTVGGRDVGCGRSPGSMLLISLLGTGKRSYVSGTQTDFAMHDGSKLSGISSALSLGGKVVMGSSIAPGLLLCGH